MALNTNYARFDNFWPGFETYNLTLDRLVRLSGYSTNEILEADAHASYQAYQEEASIRSRDEYNRYISSRQRDSYDTVYSL